MLSCWHFCRTPSHRTHPKGAGGQTGKKGRHITQHPPPRRLHLAPVTLVLPPETSSAASSIRVALDTRAHAAGKKAQGLPPQGLTSPPWPPGRVRAAPMWMVGPRGAGRARGQPSWEDKDQQHRHFRQKCIISPTHLSRARPGEGAHPRPRGVGCKTEVWWPFGRNTRGQDGPRRQKPGGQLWP